MVLLAGPVTLPRDLHLSLVARVAEPSSISPVLRHWVERPHVSHCDNNGMIACINTS
jgi:hypothetical protein